jgi:hypothetical protein
MTDERRVQEKSLAMMRPIEAKISVAEKIPSCFLTNGIGLAVVGRLSAFVALHFVMRKITHFSGMLHLQYRSRFCRLLPLHPSWLANN